MWPVVTSRIRYPVGIVPLAGSAVTAAGLICIHVPGVPAPVQTHSPPSASRQDSLRTRVPLVGGPMVVVQLTFCPARPNPNPSGGPRSGARLRRVGILFAKPLLATCFEPSGDDPLSQPSRAI